MYCGYFNFFGKDPDGGSELVFLGLTKRLVFLTQKEVSCNRTTYICVDFRTLNKSVMREVHQLPTVEETLANFNGATVFMKLDGNCSGFWQVPLAKNSKKLTTSSHSLEDIVLTSSPSGLVGNVGECMVS